MSCAAGKPNFQLLDAYVGWDAVSPDTSNLTGFEEPNGIHLELLHPGAVDPVQIIAYLPPARLARGCGRCVWYLVTPAPPGSRLLNRDACHRDWAPLWSDPRMAEPFEDLDGVAIAAWRRWIAIADRKGNQVLVWAQSGNRLMATIAFSDPGLVAFSPRGELLVTSTNNLQVAIFGIDGVAHGFLRASLPAPPNRMAVDRGDRVWIVTGDQPDSWKLWEASREDTAFKPADVARLKRLFQPTGIVAESQAGFCMSDTAPDGQAITSCFSWYGRRLEAGIVSPPSPPQWLTQGQLLTGPLDSGIPRCRWHRVRVDADVPKGTTLSVAVASTEDPTVNQGDGARDPLWQGFPPGAPHYSDWTSGPADALDFLVQDQPPGRYLFLRMRFTSDGTATPLVRRVRIDFPRVTSLEHLPAVYRELPKAEDFTERFLSLFDASIADLDRVIERYPALLDPSSVPEEVLPWLAGFFDITFDPAWEDQKRRRILQSVPQLYRLRGTLAGLEMAMDLVFGVKPAIEEMTPTGSWGSLADAKAARAYRCRKKGAPPPSPRSAKIGSTRLFGRSRARFRLGSSALCGAPLRAYGKPDLDPFSQGAYRLRILVPPPPGFSEEDRTRLANLVESQKPAHTVASVRIGGDGFFLGKWSALGIDTQFGSLRAPILGGNGNVRLNRNSILWTRRDGVPDGPSLGLNWILGT